MKRAAVQALARSVRGEVLTREAPGYDDARQVFNVGAQRRPLAIVRCADGADVQAAVAFAVDHDLPLSVRAGGHSIGGYGVAANALVVDLRALASVEVDERSQVATVGAGCTWGELARALGPFGLATPGGFDGRVGVAGLTLGGGYGLLTRAHGLACDNLRSATVVTASARTVVASEFENSDLLWALRGAGANFGVATSLRLRLHRLEALVAGAVAYPLERAREVLRAYRDLEPDLPDAATVYVGLSTAAPASVQLIAFHLGDPRQAERWLAPLTRLGGATSASFGVVPYRSTLEANLDTFPEGHCHSWRAHFVSSLEDDLLDQVADCAAHATGTPLWLVVEQLGGAMRRVGARETAFAHRDAHFGVVTAVKWRPGHRPGRALLAQERLDRALAPWSTGRYVNYVGRGYGPKDVAAAYGANLPRLSGLKRTWDPENLFRHNVNVRPGKG